MTCPLKQMALDHFRDQMLIGWLMDDGSWDSQGNRMWFMASIGMGVAETHNALGHGCKQYLEAKYPWPVHSNR